LAIAVAGYRLARYGDVIAEKTKLGGTWIGVILLATVTSLPELTTSVSSVTVANAPDIAVGDIMGSCVFNLLLVAVLDFLYRKMPIYRKASQGHILSAGFSVILIGIAVFSLLSGDAAMLRLGHIGLYSPAIIVLYVVAVRAIFVQEKRRAADLTIEVRYGHITLREAATRYATAGLIVVAAGIAMPFAAVHLAQSMGWSQSFVGTLLVATATSLPEAASTIGALRIGAVDLAIGNLFGSNLFNILILAIDDIAYLNGPLLTQVSQTHAVSGVSAMIMTGAAVVGVRYRPATRVFRIVGWVSLALVLTYVLNSLVLYMGGH
jgi:cation:H+ antiporter